MNIHMKNDRSIIKHDLLIEHYELEFARSSYPIISQYVLGIIQYKTKINTIRLRSSLLNYTWSRRCPIDLKAETAANDGSMGHISSHAAWTSQACSIISCIEALSP